MLKEKKEKTILFISFAAGAVCAIAEYIFSISSHSQSVLMDAVYDASELIFIMLTLFMTPLFYKPISEKHPYGFFQIESIFLIIKIFMMLAVTLSVSVEIIESALAGGNPVHETDISIFQLCMGVFSVIIFIVMKRINHSLSSPTVNAEILGWKLDIGYSLGLSLAFFGATFLEKTPLAFISPYFDQIVAVLVMVCMLPESIKVLINAIKDIFLFSPDDETVNKIKEICTCILDNFTFKPVFFDITRTGRHIWVSVYFQIENELLKVDDVKQASEKINSKVNSVFDNCTCELILSP